MRIYECGDIVIVSALLDEVKPIAATYECSAGRRVGSGMAAW
jgi:hypothetical protein